MEFFNFDGIIQQKKLEEKIKLKKEDVSLQFVYSRPANNNYTIRFIVQLHPVLPQIFSNIISNQIRASQINMISLHDAILANIDEKDRKYITLTSFDTLKCDFNFNFDKWLNDTLNGVSPKTYISKFDQEYKLKIQPPKIIMYDIMRINFFNFISKKFKEYIQKKNYDKKWFGPLLPKNWQKKINIKLSNMFDYDYDYMNNRFIVKMKSFYILGGAMLIGIAYKEIKKQDFSVRVEKNINNFSKNQWRDFIKKKFMTVNIAGIRRLCGLR